jgi:5-methylcytosine-specific restriction endonuclease McrA
MPTRFEHKIKARSTLDVSKAVRLGGVNRRKWPKVRRLQLMQNPTCADCGAVAEEVHHLIERAVRPDLMYCWDNLISLCCKCHKNRHLQKPRF